MNTTLTAEDLARFARTRRRCLRVAVALIPINFGVWMIALGSDEAPAILLFTLLALIQFGFAVVAAVAGYRGGQGVVGPVLAAIAAPVGWTLGAIGLVMTGLGGAWGRPLRIRGRQLHPELREGTDWTRGPRPDTSALDPATRGALEALWLHDAQKEHASVPAFARISWLLAAVGAPAELLEWAHRAALEEIEHTRLCFALAAGYGQRSHSVEAMPDLLLPGALAEGDPLVTLATESVGDGCQLEDFNADVAAACARACREPVTRRALEQIAREERSHAEFSWALLAWLLARDRRRVEPALADALARLGRYPRPTAVSRDKLALVRAADAELLREHGRLADREWAELWDMRLCETRRRAEALMAPAARCA